MNSSEVFIQRIKELLTVGESFNPARWEHWLLLGCFFVISGVALWLSWHWRKESKKRP